MIAIFREDTETSRAYLMVRSILHPPREMKARCFGLGKRSVDLFSAMREPLFFGTMIPEIDTYATLRIDRTHFPRTEDET